VSLDVYLADNRTDSKASEMKGEITRMWPGGPLRLFSTPAQAGKDGHLAGWIRYTHADMDGWAGPYVCEACRKAGAGVYEVKGKWICGGRRNPKAAARKKRRPVAINNQLHFS
jgi:hypothetical protein